MATKHFLDQTGLKYLWTKIANAISNSAKATEKKIPTKTSQLTNDSGFLTTATVPTAITDDVISSIVNETYSTESTT